MLPTKQHGAGFGLNCGCLTDGQLLCWETFLIALHYLLAATLQELLPILLSSSVGRNGMSYTKNFYSPITKVYTNAVVVDRRLLYNWAVIEVQWARCQDFCREKNISDM